MLSLKLSLFFLLFFSFEPFTVTAQEKKHIYITSTNPSTSVHITWRTQTNLNTALKYRLKGDINWLSVPSTIRPLPSAGTTREVTLQSLQPNRQYEYQITGDDNVTETFSFWTLPAPNDLEDFDAIYVADTGLVGRTDGLTIGTEKLISYIADLKPKLILGGGDYVYYNTDKRYGNLQNSMDAWFEQMKNVTQYTQLFGTFGNHETLLSENITAWRERFAPFPPNSFSNHFEFRVGRISFLSILADDDNQVKLPSAELQWIENAIINATRDGFISVPYFHASPFADGKNHPSSKPLRNNLCPIFTRQNIKLAISSHDQAYERTYPLKVFSNSDIQVASTNVSSFDGTEGGTVYMKISPGGKLSNKNAAFSQFMTIPPPFWSGIRENSHHIFAHLNFQANGYLNVTIYGIDTSGARAIVDSFSMKLFVTPSTGSQSASSLMTSGSTQNPQDPVSSSKPVSSSLGSAFSSNQTKSLSEYSTTNVIESSRMSPSTTGSSPETDKLEIEILCGCSHLLPSMKYVEMNLLVKNSARRATTFAIKLEGLTSSVQFGFVEEFGSVVFKHGYHCSSPHLFTASVFDTDFVVQPIYAQVAC